jgi:3-hydroxyethyl bacteriochlorophyllide a dehydrogenase
VPEGLPAEEAVLLGLCAVAMRGIEIAGIPAGAKVLVCGLGVIGQYAVQVCRLKGAEVTATDVVEARLQTAKAVRRTIRPRLIWPCLDTRRSARWWRLVRM